MLSLQDNNQLKFRLESMASKVVILNEVRPIISGNSDYYLFKQPELSEKISLFKNILFMLVCRKLKG